MPLSDNNIEMNQETFWALLREAKDKCGQNLRAEADWITEQLLFMGSDQALAFHEIMDAYKELANRYGLWNAADLMMDWCSDDGFIDFRAWLIAQGKEVYLAALKEPDSLAEVTPYGGCTFESLSYVGYHAYEKLTGRCAYDDAFHGYDPQMVDALKAELGKEIVYKPGIEKPLSWKEVAEQMPRLCAKYLSPEALTYRIQHGTGPWNYDSPDIQAALNASKKKHERKGGESR